MNKKRPRLADHALVRRHLRDGETIVVVHDARNGALFQLPPSVLDLVLCADGTRDLEGIGLAAVRAGAAQSLEEIAELVDELDALGLIEEGIEPPPVRSDAFRYETPSQGVEADRPLEHLEGYGFSCSGKSACCRQYGSVTLTADDVARARRAGLETVPGDERGEKTFLPLFGGVRTERVAMTLVDGRCLQLTDSGRCGLEERGGPLAKPIACRVYPASLLDDGERIRVSVALECDCVFESLDTSGAPLVDGARGGDLPSGVRVARIPEAVLVAGAQTRSREEIARWSLGVARALTPERVPEKLAALAAALEALQPGEPLPAWPASSPDRTASDALYAAIGTFATRMAAAAAAAAEWRSDSDRTRLLRQAVAEASRKIASNRAQFERALADEPRLRDEAFFVRAVLFSHQLSLTEPVAQGLLAMAARVLTSRALGDTARELGHPLAAVQAAARGALV
ncbi:MAG: YkgJ family cysteine cluster protein [Polyangiaceae bacterium]|nr:YkgJ family cysteine cluster protein [Polyangiaceae bacterium]